MAKVEFTLAAEADLREAAAFYASVRPLHGRKFIQAVESAVQKLTANPRVGHPAGHGCRKLRISRLPFVLVYAVAAKDRLVIHAFVHERRDPTRWHERLP